MTERAFDSLMRVIERTLAAALLLAVGLNFINAAGRYGLGGGLPWADEIQVYLLVWITFLGAAVASRRNLHLRVDILTRALPLRLQPALRALELAATLGMAGFAAWLSAGYVGRVYALDHASDGTGFPMWLPHSALTVGFALIAAGSLLGLVLRR